MRLKHNVSKAWSNIDVFLKQRHDEIPKLVETGQPYIISATREADLVARKIVKAYTTVIASFMAFGVLVLLFSIRAPLSI